LGAFKVASGAHCWDGRDFLLNIADGFGEMREVFADFRGFCCVGGGIGSCNEGLASTTLMNDSNEERLSVGELGTSHDF